MEPVFTEKIGLKKRLRHECRVLLMQTAKGDDPHPSFDSGSLKASQATIELTQTFLK